MKGVVAAVLTIGMWMMPATLSAQATGAEILGTAKDDSGGVLPGVTVIVKNVETGVTRNLVTGEDGRYRAPDLPVGNYEVQGELQGFRTAVRRGILLTVGRAAVVDLTLGVGTLEENIVVTGDAPLVDVTTSSLGGLVDQEQIKDLPLNGRNFVQLALLETGVAQARSATQQATFGYGLKMSVNGGRMDYNNFMMDGTSMNSINQVAVGGASGQALGSEAIQEFQVLTSNFSAEFGRSGGGVINVVTKSGTNAFSGSASYFNRNESMDAKNYFDTANLPDFLRNQYAFTLGGPIKRNQTFFFAAYERLRETLARTFIGTVPTLAARQGILPAGTIAVDPRVRPYLDLYPAPNGRDLGDGRAEYIRTDNDETRQNFSQFRVDHNFSNSDSVFIRYTMDISDKTRPHDFNHVRFIDPVDSKFATGEYKKILSSRLLNVVRAGYNRSYVEFGQEYQDPRFLDRSLWFVDDPYAPGFGFTVSGLTTIGGAFNLPRWRYDDVIQLTNTTTYTPGRHAIRFGGEFQHIKTNEEDTTGGVGNFGFTSLTSLLTAQPRTFSVVRQNSDFGKQWRQNLVAMFFQDDVRVKDNLTVNLGVRWEFITDPTEADGKATNVLNPFTDTPADVRVGKRLMELPKDNIAPRIGFAWAPGGNSKTSVRGGFGLFYPLLFRVYWFINRSLPPFVNEITAETPQITFPRPTSAQLRTPLVAGNAMEFSPNQPRIAQYNLTLQREVLENTVVTVGYVGSRGVNSPHYVDVNTAVPQILADGTKFFPAGSPRRNPAWAVFRWKITNSENEYNALQLKLTRRLVGGLQFQGSYTLSHSLDHSSEHGSGGLQNQGAAQDWENLDQEYASSGFDVRHLSTINLSYLLPGPAPDTMLAQVLGGWQIAGIVTLSSGNPFSVTNSFDRDRDASTSNQSRPNLVAGASNSPILGGPERYFDPLAFELQPAGFYGNLGRNTLEGPGYSTVDLALTKNLTIADRMNLQFRAEAFNVLNTANFGLPSSVVFRTPDGVHATDAGRITSTSGTARQGQVGVKLMF